MAERKPIDVRLMPVHSLLHAIETMAWYGQNTADHDPEKNQILGSVGNLAAQIRQHLDQIADVIEAEEKANG